ncbi:MAG: Spy/CpxP family protein refolding chaperone [Solidesulfovibrio sp.]
MTIKSIKLLMVATVTATAFFIGGFSPIARAQETPAPAVAEQPKPARYSVDWIERRITQLHARLHITAEQESAWNDVATAMRDNAKSMQVLIERWANQAAKMTAIDSLRLHGEMAEENAKGQHKLIPAFEKLYNLMQDEQKKIADEVFARHEGRRHRRNK